MIRNRILLTIAVLTVAPLAYAHNGADGIPGTPDTTCETGTEWADHDYAPTAAGLFIQGLQESNLEDCDGDFDPTDPFCWAEEAAREDLDGDTDVCERFDDDGHDEYTRGGAWLLVNSGDGVTGGTVLCFGRDGHHPSFGPVQVEDLALGGTVPFTVEADLVDAAGLADPCGDFQSDVSTSCVGTCSVTFPAGLDGSYQVYVGFGAPGTMGHVCTPGGDCSGDGGGSCPADAPTTAQGVVNDAGASLPERCAVEGAGQEVDSTVGGVACTVLIAAATAAAGPGAGAIVGGVCVTGAAVVTALICEDLGEELERRGYGVLSRWCLVALCVGVASD